LGVTVCAEESRSKHWSLYTQVFCFLVLKFEYCVKRKGVTLGVAACRLCRAATKKWQELRTVSIETQQKNNARLSHLDNTKKVGNFGLQQLPLGGWGGCWSNFSFVGTEFCEF
jgi:hypothetical protein